VTEFTAKSLQKIIGFWALSLVVLFWVFHSKRGILSPLVRQVFMYTLLPPLSQRTSAADGKSSLLILENRECTEQMEVCSIKEKEINGQLNYIYSVLQVLLRPISISGTCFFGTRSSSFFFSS